MRNLPHFEIFGFNPETQEWDYLFLWRGISNLGILRAERDAKEFNKNYVEFKAVYLD